MTKLSYKYYCILIGAKQVYYLDECEVRTRESIVWASNLSESIVDYISSSSIEDTYYRLFPKILSLIVNSITFTYFLSTLKLVSLLLLEQSFREYFRFDKIFKLVSHIGILHIICIARLNRFSTRRLLLICMIQVTKFLCLFRSISNDNHRRALYLIW